jgi:hypothetical protein
MAQPIPQRLFLCKVPGTMQQKPAPTIRLTHLATVLVQLALVTVIGICQPFVKWVLLVKVQAAYLEQQTWSLICQA